ncbi:MAG TPA: hypothetical protein PKD09_17915 [Aggregatilinea sp.]|uniref:hypothetical protein n=1 Tax=Aggregatilinea sp. TaxID=2806333 RepID=UPI002C0FB1AA|nr:hypothetical protein [Aggregatilinea sp.]HML23538.1 hypothetical protein [Aggregatilinea sp.]
MPEQVNEQIIRIKLDKQSAAQINQAIAEHTAGLKQEAAQWTKLEQTARQAAETFRKYGNERRALEREQFANEAAREAKNLLDVADSFDEVTRAANEAASAQGKALSVPTINTNQAAQQRAASVDSYQMRPSALPELLSSTVGYEVARPLYAIQDLSDVLEGVSKSAPSAVLQMGLLGGGAAALGVGLGLLKDQFDANKQAAENYRNELAKQFDLDEQRRLFLANATSEDVQAQIDAEAEKKKAAEQNLAIYEQQSQKVQNLINQYGQYEEVALNANVLNPDEAALVAEAQQKMQDLFATPITITTPQAGKLEIKSINDAEGALAQLGEAAAGAQKDFDAAAEAEQFWRDNITDSTVVNNDRALDDAHWTKVTTDNAKLRMQTELTANERIMSWSSEQAAARVQAAETEKSLLATYLDGLYRRKAAGEDVDAEIAQAEAQFKSLTLEIRELTDAVIPAVKASEEATRRQKEFADATDAMRKASQEAAQLEKQRTAILAKYAQATGDVTFDRARADERELEDVLRTSLRNAAKHFQDLTKLDQTFRDKQAELAEKATEDQTEADDARRKAESDYFKDSTKATKDHLKRIDEIYADASDSLEDAIASRNVTAAIDAVENGQKALQKEQDRYDEEQRQRDQAFQELKADLKIENDEKAAQRQKDLDDLRKNYEQQRAERIAAYNDQRQQEAEDRTIRLRRLEQDRDREDELRERALNENLDAIDKTKEAGLAMFGEWRRAAARLTIKPYLEEAPKRAEQRYQISNIDRYFASGITSGTVPPGAIVGVGEQGFEAAQFGRDGQWRIFNDRQMHMLSGGGDTLQIASGAVVIEAGAGDPAAILAAVEQGIGRAAYDGWRAAKARRGARR